MKKWLIISLEWLSQSPQIGSLFQLISFAILIIGLTIRSQSPQIGSLFQFNGGKWWWKLKGRVSIPSNRVIVSIGTNGGIQWLNGSQSPQIGSLFQFTRKRLTFNNRSQSPQIGSLFQLIMRECFLKNLICLNPLKSGHCFNKNKWIYYKPACLSSVSIPSNRVIVSIFIKEQEKEDGPISSQSPQIGSLFQ